MALAFHDPLARSIPTTTGRPHLVVIEGGAAQAAPSTRTRPDRSTFLRRRLAVVALALGVAAGIVGVARPGGDAAVTPAAPTSFAVSPGDTLWSVVGRLGVDGDRHAVVARLAEVNGGTVLRPGQRLTIPADVVAMRS